MDSSCNLQLCIKFGYSSFAFKVIFAIVDPGNHCICIFNCKILGA